MEQMSNKKANYVLKNYVIWRDVRIPAIEEQLETVSPSFIASYSSGSGGSGNGISNPTQRESVQRDYLIGQLMEFRRTVRIMAWIRDTLEDDCVKLFDLLSDPKGHTRYEIEVATGLTTKEVRYRREKILKYMRETFDGLSLPLSS